MEQSFRESSMNKKLLAAAVTAAVFAAPAAFAEGTIYGKFHTSIDYSDPVGGGNQNYLVSSRSSRLGFKGSEDLGNGMKAIFQAEFSVQTDGNDGGRGQDGGDGWGGQRNTFIGLSSDWGTVLVGRHDTPLKVAFYGAGVETLGDSIIDLNLSNSLQPSKSNTAPIGVFSEYRADNAIAYVSPNFSGFTFVGAVIPGEDIEGDNGGDERDGIADHYSLGAMYSGGGLKVGGGYQMTTADPDGNGPSSSNDQKTWQLGGSYTMNAFMVGAQYESTDSFAFSDDNDYTAWAVTGKYTFGNNAISAVYTDSELDTGSGSSASDSDTSGWGLAAEHNFSKRTKVYVAYAHDEDDEKPGDSGNASQASLGMIHNF